MQPSTSYSSVVALDEIEIGAPSEVVPLEFLQQFATNVQFENAVPPDAPMIRTVPPRSLRPGVLFAMKRVLRTVSGWAFAQIAPPPLPRSCPYSPEMPMMPQFVAKRQLSTYTRLKPVA